MLIKTGSKYQLPYIMKTRLVLDEYCHIPDNRPMIPITLRSTAIINCPSVQGYHNFTLG